VFCECVFRWFNADTNEYGFVTLWGMINNMGAMIDAGELAEANGLRYGIGDSCHKSHIVHMPPQYAKVDGK